jgi:hypothetical protein
VDESNTLVMLSEPKFKRFSAPKAWSSTPFKGTRATLMSDVNGDHKADLVAVDESNTFVMLAEPKLKRFSLPTAWSGTMFFGSWATL